MVIQRWQSVMLLIACVMMGIFSFISLGQIQTPDYTFNITTMGICREGIATAAGEPTGTGTLYIFILSVLTAILALLGIFCFKNMKLQKRIIAITMLCTVTATVQAMYSSISYAGDNEIGWSVFIGAPVVALVADIAAYRLICSDQKKLRAADRLR